MRPQRKCPRDKGQLSSGGSTGLVQGFRLEDYYSGTPTLKVVYLNSPPILVSLGSWEEWRRRVKIYEKMSSKSDKKVPFEANTRTK